MAKAIKPDVSAVYLLPPSIDDWIGSDHPARFVADFVDALDLEALGFRVSKSDVGRPCYSEGLLLRVVLYCYMLRVRSVREMERQCRDNIAVIWLTGNHVPDHNTLWRFWKRNREAIGRVFKQSVRIAADQGLVGMVLQAVDGTKLRAECSWESALVQRKLRAALEKVDQAVLDLEKGMKAAGKSGGSFKLPPELVDAHKRREEIKAALSRLEAEERSHLHEGEPDARVMKCSGQLAFAYNAQAVVDEANGIVVAAEVCTSENDVGQLAPMLDAVVENLGRTAETTVADLGYSAGADLAAAEDKGNVVTNLKKNVNPGPKVGEFHVSRFTYDEVRDCFICPMGGTLSLQRSKPARRGDGKISVYHCDDWKDCPWQKECSSNKRGRIISPIEHHRAVERARKKLADPRARLALSRRPAIIETLFGFVKHNQGFRRLTMRGLESVRAQWAILCLVVNLHKMHKAWLAAKLATA